MKIGSIQRGKQRYFYALVPTRYLTPEEISSGKRPRVMASSRDGVQEKFDNEIAQRRKGIDVSGAQTRISGFFEWFLDFYKTEGGVAPRTWGDYSYHAQKNILPYLGAIRLGELRPANIDDWTKALR